MTATAYPTRIVRCPTCADTFPWVDDGQVWIYDAKRSSYEKTDVSTFEPVKRADLRRRGYRLCPNPSADTPEHYLPGTWGEHPDPLAIGLVGQSLSGKTHLLTAMIAEAHNGQLQSYGIRTTSLDFLRHDRFKRQFIEPFLAGRELPGTTEDTFDAADILLLRGPTGPPRPVVFFDVAGEDLASLNVGAKTARFLLAANAVIFVLATEDSKAGSAAAASENTVFDLAVERILNRPKDTDIPAAIALTKSDRLRYVPPVDRWLRHPAGRGRSWRDARAESRDVYAHLYRTGAASSLTPYESFTRCTLHFVSASGGDASGGDPGESGRERKEGTFARGVHPARVLDPLIAILTMIGFLPDPDSGQVGRW